MRLLNLQTGVEEDLSPDQVATGLAQGLYVPPDEQGVLLTPQGKLVFVPAMQVNEAVNKYGYTVPEPDALMKIGEGYKYRTPGMQAAAFAAGAARGGSFAVSDFLATETGFTTPENLRKLKEYQPGASGVGEIAGILGTSFIPGSPVARVVSGAKKVEDFTRAAMLARLPANSLAKRLATLAGETTARGAAGAFEGAAYGLGQSISEASLGDEDLTAQKVISNIGQGAFLGGALSAALVPTKVVLSKAIDKAKGAFNKLSETFLGKFEPVEAKVANAEIAAAEAAVPQSLFEPSPAPMEQFKPGIISSGVIKAKAAIEGKPENEIVASLQRNVNAKWITPEELDSKAVEFQSQLENMMVALRKANSKVFTKTRDEEIRNLLVGVPSETAQATFNNFIRQGFEIISSMKGKKWKYDKVMWKNLEEELKGMAEQSEG